MVHQNSDHILAHPGTETTSIVNDNWMDLHIISQDSATAPPQNSRKLMNVSSCPPLRCSTRPSIQPKRHGQDCASVVLKNLEGRNVKDLDSKYVILISYIVIEIIFRNVKVLILLMLIVFSNGY